MQQPIIDEKAADRSVSERLEGIEDELQLLKSEVKQTLIDLREFMMKGSALSVTSVFDAPKVSSSNGQVVAPQRQESPPSKEPPAEIEGFMIGTPEVQNAPPSQVSAAEHQDADETEQSGPELHSTAMTTPTPFPQAFPVAVPQPTPALGAPQIAVLEPTTAAPALTNARDYHRCEDPMDVVRMGRIVGWLGTAAEKGLTPKQLKPFLQAYERSGHLTPSLAMFAYGSLEELNSDKVRFSLSCSPAEVTQCLQELHEIIINPGYAPAPEPPVDNGHDG